MLPNWGPLWELEIVRCRGKVAYLNCESSSEYSLVLSSLKLGTLLLYFLEMPSFQDFPSSVVVSEGQAALEGCRLES